MIDAAFAVYRQMKYPWVEAQGYFFYGNFNIEIFLTIIVKLAPYLCTRNKEIVTKTR